jgi:hypothetical protein
MEDTQHSWRNATTSCQMHVSKLDVEMITPLPDRITINEGDQLKLFCETSNFFFFFYESRVHYFYK